MRPIAAIAVCLLLSGAGLAQQPLVFTQISNTPDQVVGAEVLRVALERMGWPVSFRLLPGSRALEMSSSGKLDGEVHRIWEIGDRYPTLRRVPTPINHIETAGFVRQGSAYAIEKCGDLQPYSVAVVRGIKHTELCSEGVRSVSVSNDGESMMRFVALGRADVALDARFNGLVQLKRSGLDSSLTPLPKTLGRLLLYTYVHEKHAALVPRLDTEFQKMAESGEMAAIRDRVIQQVLAGPSTDE